MYKALNEGVYESSDAYQVDDNYEQQNQGNENEDAFAVSSKKQQAPIQIENERPS